MHGRHFFPVVTLLIAFLPAASMADDAVERGRVQAATCLGCHGVPSYTNVYPSYHVPKLGGQHAEYIKLALKAYRSGERQHPTMRAHATRMSDKQIDDIAAYLASLK